MLVAAMFAIGSAFTNPQTKLLCGGASLWYKDSEGVFREIVGDPGPFCVDAKNEYCFYQEDPEHPGNYIPCPDSQLGEKYDPPTR